jgi:hypothetical protein
MDIPTILFAVLASIGSSVASGMTWDMIKATGQAVINYFAETFTKNKHFTDEQQAKDFLEDIATSAYNGTENPYEEAWRIYNKITGKLADKAFQHEFEEWIISEKDALFKSPNAIAGKSHTSISTGDIIATGASSVSISVNQR